MGRRCRQAHRTRGNHRHHRDGGKTVRRRPGPVQLQNAAMWLTIGSAVLYGAGAILSLTGVGLAFAPVLFIAATAVGAASTAATCAADWGGDQTGCVVGAATLGVGGLARPASAAIRGFASTRAGLGVVRDGVRAATWVGGSYGALTTGQYAYGRYVQ